ncbi:AEC family transporter [Clostridium weizhouense]|uniref:AEC family transporter n=1 Tax=Clostridium weizhouense TaxID=2859781 RepID=A0ABS7APA4_9CLOT|nr:AEC family transporter [Clostridium weizhouense]MBW6410459.1 AEC family transporter [Clostridium weizhouense]
MQNIILALNVVLPLFITITLGYFIRKINLFDDHTLKIMNKVTFKVFLPLLLFFNVYKTNLKGVFNLKLVIFAPSIILVSCISMCFIIPIIEKENRKRGVLVQAIFRSNFVLFGLPVTLSLFGDENAGVPSLLIAIIVPMFNFLAVIVLEIFRGGKINLKETIKGIITNPLIVSSLLGIVFMLNGIRLPNVIEKTISDLSKVATPLALVVLGGSFKVNKIKGYTKQLIIGILGRLVVIPSIFVPIAIILGFRKIELATIMIMLAAPTAVSSFTMAEQMDGDSELAGQLVVFTSAFAVISIFLWVFFIKKLGYI